MSQIASTASTSQRSVARLRSRFDDIYGSCIVGGGFFESDEYYQFEKERYWRSLELLCQLNVAAPAKLLEIGGGQLALLCNELFGDNCTVADISQRYSSPLQKAGIECLTFNLMGIDDNKISDEFDVVMLLEVIEHIPCPAHV